MRQFIFLKGEFQKGYTPSWSQEIFKITKATSRQGKPIYELADLAGEVIDGMFYEVELSPVNKNIEESVFKIEKILKTRGKGKRKEYFVHWLDWPSKFDSWIPASNLQ